MPRSLTSQGAELSVQLIISFFWLFILLQVFFPVWVRPVPQRADPECNLQGGLKLEKELGGENTGVGVGDGGDVSLAGLRNR